VRRIAVARRRSTTPDGVLAQEAAAGSGTSYAALYDRYEAQVFNYSLRLVGSPEDAADATHEAFLGVLRRLQHDDRPVLDFSSYLFAAARHESYAVMRRRARVHPAETPPEDPGRTTDIDADPERAALLRDSQEAVRAANARLAPRHREVLALRELGDRSYDEIGQIMGISPNAAAQLIWRARAKLREALAAGAVASIVASSMDCERAQLLMTRRQDGELLEEAEAAWLDEHLEECRSCRTAEAMLLDVAVSYRAWLPVAALAGMRSDVLTSAGELVGADWSGVASAGPPSAPGSGSGALGAGAGAATVVAVGIALWALLQGDSPLERRTAEATPPTAAAAAAPAADRGGQPPGRAIARPASLRRGAAPMGVTPDILRPRRLEPLGGRTGRSTPAVPRDGPRGPADPPRRPSSPDPPAAETPGPPATAPAPPADPADPVEPVEPPAEPPEPPAPPGCSWPGNGNGPGGCPPGHGGTPPGHGGAPPGPGG
jgi:RNA polymerase sigma factor (sigma-70 family)